MFINFISLYELVIYLTIALVLNKYCDSSAVPGAVLSSTSWYRTCVFSFSLFASVWKGLMGVTRLFFQTFSSCLIRAGEGAPEVTLLSE